MAGSELTEANSESGREGAPSGWRPIETAPRDGTEIIVCGPYDEPCVVSWSGRNWVGSFQGQSSLESQGDTWTDYHMAQVAEKLVWQPLPVPPPMADGDFLPDGASSAPHTDGSTTGSDQDLIDSLTKEVEALRGGIDLAINTIDAAAYAAREIGAVASATVMERDLEKLRALSTSGRAAG